MTKWNIFVYEVAYSGKWQDGDLIRWFGCDLRWTNVDDEILTFQIDGQKIESGSFESFQKFLNKFTDSKLPYV